MSAVLRLSLQALQYPPLQQQQQLGSDPLQILLDSRQHYQSLVLWLENTKVRRYAEEQRAGLVATQDWDAWQLHFGQYLRDVDYPYAYSWDERWRVIEWLVGHAVGYCYRDSAGACNQVTAKDDDMQVDASEEGRGMEEQGHERTRVAVAAPYPDLQGGGSGHDNVSQQLARLEQVLGLAPDAAAAAGGQRQEQQQQGGELVARLRDVCRVVGQQLLPAVSQQQQQQAKEVAAAGGGGSSSGGGGSVLDGLLQEQAWPAGLGTGDAAVDNAARVLRALYIQDLLAQQAQHHALQAEVQEHTAGLAPKSATR